MFLTFDKYHINIQYVCVCTYLCVRLLILDSHIQYVCVHLYIKSVCVGHSVCEIVHVCVCQYMWDKSKYSYVSVLTSEVPAIQQNPPWNPTGGKDSRTSLGSRRQRGVGGCSSVGFGVSNLDVMAYSFTRPLKASSSVRKTSK